jgi:hypothetical protein
MAIGALTEERLAPVRPEPAVRATPSRPIPVVAARHWLAERTRGEMAAGSVVYHAPSTAFQSPGGGENQLIQTGRYLEAQGLSIRPFAPWTDRLDRAGLLHLFGMSREGLQLARVARAKGVPVVLSPICWIEPRAMAALATDRLGRLANQAKWRLKALAPRFPTWRRDLLGSVDAILPNSAAEGEQLVRWFGADPARTPTVSKSGSPAPTPPPSGTCTARPTSSFTSAGSSRGRTCSDWSKGSSSPGCPWW